MFEYIFSYDKILSPSTVKKYGILYDEEKFSFESYWEGNFNHYERLFYTDEKGEKAPFKGLLYELYQNGLISGYAFYKDGYEEGQNVDFYKNGNISKYTDYQKNVEKAFIMEWFENGSVKKVLELSDHSRHKKFVEYDEQGNIVKQGET